MSHLRLDLCVSVLALAALPLPALAGTTVVGTGTPASCTEAALNSAITVANGTFGIVTFNCGPNPHAIVVTSEKALAIGVVIDGGNKITLSGGNSTRIFSLFQGAAVSLQNLVLRNGFAATGGGCVLAASSTEDPAQLVVNNVWFEECRAGNYGGAIAGTDAVLTIQNSTFVANEADGAGGGAISLNGDNLEITSSLFLLNATPGQGGALQVWSSIATITDTRFERNFIRTNPSNLWGGGAVLSQGSTLTFNRSVFFANSSTLHGGAVFAALGSTYVFQDSELTTNFALDGEGGGIVLDGSSQVTLRRTTMVFNAAQVGGAIASNGSLQLENSTLSTNTASLNGPAINATLGLVEMVSATLVDNYVPGDLNAGQFAWDQGATVNVHNTLFGHINQVAAGCEPGNPGNFSFSLWSSSSCGSSVANGNQPGSTVALRPLQVSCGRTRTHNFASAAENGIDQGACRIGDPLIDQRGMARPQGLSCDIGAVEFFANCPNPFFAADFEFGTTFQWDAAFP